MQFRTFLKRHKFADNVEAAIGLFRVQYATDFLVLGDKDAADRIRLGVKPTQDLYKHFSDSFGIVTEYKLKTITVNGVEKRVRDFVSSAVVDIRGLVERFVNTALTYRQMVLPEGEFICCMLYHDAATSLACGRKLNGFFLHFLQMKAPGAVHALLPIGVMHGNDSKANLATFLSRHEVENLQIFGKGKEKKTMAVRHALCELANNGVVVGGRKRNMWIGFYADYHAIEASIVAPRDTTINARVNYPGTDYELKRIEKKGIGNCQWATQLPCWGCSRKAFELFRRVEKLDKSPPCEGVGTIFGSCVKFIMYGRLHGIALLVGSFVYDVAMAYMKHRGKTNFVTKEAQAAFHVTATGGISNGWCPGRLFDSRGNPHPRAKAPALPAGEKRKYESNKGNRPEYKDVCEWIDTNKWLQLRYALAGYENPPIKDGEATLVRLVEFISTIRGTDPINSEDLREKGRKIWNWWIQLLETVFPADTEKFTEEFKRSAFCPRFDPHNLGIAAGAHNVLIHTADYVEFTGGYFHAAFEAAGEAALFQLTQMYERFHLRRCRLHLQAPWNLLRGLANVFGRLAESGSDESRATALLEASTTRRLRKRKRGKVHLVDVRREDFDESAQVIVSDDGSEHDVEGADLTDESDGHLADPPTP